MIDAAPADANAFCRWDDDDLSLPHRLSYSLNKLGDKLEWRAENYWFDNGELHEITGAANTHIMSLFTRECLEVMGGYPAKHTGNEDKAFNAALGGCGINKSGEKIPTQDIYYLYRWGTGSRHLSGAGGTTDQLQQHWNNIGTLPVEQGTYEIKPRWYRNYIAYAEQRTNRPQPQKELEIVAGYFNYNGYYDHVAAKLPSNGIAVEVGCLYGRSAIYLSQALKKHGKRTALFAVDFGLGVGQRHVDYGYVGTLFANVRECGASDNIGILATESTFASKAFADNSLDFVFLDAAHDYQSVKADLQCWYPKIKIGGTIAGHDWAHRDYPGVTKAVLEFFNRTEKSYLTAKQCPDVWEWVKL